MVAIILRILVVAGLGFGAYKAYPYYQPLIQKQLESPAVLGLTTIPVIEKVNEVLPENIQIPTPKSNPKENNSDSNTPEAIQKVVEEVKIKTTEITQQQLDVIKQEASKQFCSILLEKIKNECGGL